MTKFTLITTLYKSETEQRRRSDKNNKINLNWYWEIPGHATHRMHTIHLVQWLSWVFANQGRKKEIRCHFQMLFQKLETKAIAFVISPISNLIWLSVLCSLRFFCHISFEKKPIRLRLEIEVEWHYNSCNQKSRRLTERKSDKGTCLIAGAPNSLLCCAVLPKVRFISVHHLSLLERKTLPWTVARLFIRVLNDGVGVSKKARKMS